MTNQPNFSPFAILAGILFNLDKNIRTKVKPDDAAEEVDVDLPVVNIEERDGALVCVLPLGAVSHFSENPYDTRIMIEQDPINPSKGRVIIAFAPKTETSNLFSVNGHKFTSGNSALDQLMAKLR